MNIALPSQLTKTLICAHLELENITPVVQKSLLDYSLNTKYNILPTNMPVANPKLRYFGIGIRGFKNLNDQQMSAPYIPSASNMDMFTPLPFRIVPVTSDLSAAERDNYRMRVSVNFGGVDYFAYYLKKLTIIDNTVKFILTDLVNNVESELATLDSTNLTPLPSITTAEGVVTPTSQITTSVTASMIITGEEVHEAINVIYNGDMLRAKVSEIGVYTGEDFTNTVNNTTYTESIYTHLAYHRCNIGSDFSDITKVDTVNMRINSAKAFLI